MGNNYLIVLLSGKAQNGKSTASQYISEQINKRAFGSVTVTIKPFAKALKDLCTDLFGWDGDKGMYADENGKIIEDKGRRLLINVAFVLRGIRPTVWAETVVKNIKATIMWKPNVFIIDDMRYKNELELMNKEFPKNLLTVRINSTRVVPIDDPSEKDLDGQMSWDIIINNNGTIEEYYSSLELVVNEVIRRLNNG